jgi:hypothetical protein
VRATGDFAHELHKTPVGNGQPEAGAAVAAGAAGVGLYEGLEDGVRRKSMMEPSPSRTVSDNQ